MSNFTPETDPQIRALAKAAAWQIKTLCKAHNAQIEAIYKDFQAKVEALTPCSLTPTITEGLDGEASADELDTRSADLLPTDR